MGTDSSTAYRSVASSARRSRELFAGEEYVGALPLLSASVGKHLEIGHPAGPRAELGIRLELVSLAEQDGVGFLEDVVGVGQAGHEGQDVAVEPTLDGHQPTAERIVGLALAHRVATLRPDPTENRRQETLKRERKRAPITTTFIVHSFTAEVWRS